MIDPGAPIWRVRMLGALSLRGEYGVADRFSTRKAASLVGFLAYHADRAHSRDRLADLLWPDTPNDLARQSLRTALWTVRRQVEPRRELAHAVLTTNRDSVGIRHGALETDVDAFWSALRNASEARVPGEMHWLEQAVALYKGEFLAGLDDAWVILERERLRSACAGALLRGAHLQEETGAVGDALDWARRSVECDPLSEEGHVTVVRLHLAAGRRVEAVRHAREAGRIWRDELEMAPSEAIDGLLRVVAAAEGTSGPKPAAIGLGRDTDTHRPDAYLPVPLTRIFGREREKDHIVGLLQAAGDDATRLVTISGVGGCGKTRLALEVAHELKGAFGDAVALVALEAAGTGADLLTAIMRALRLPAAPRADAVDPVNERLRTWRTGDDRRVLLVLDALDSPSDDMRSILLGGLLPRCPDLVCLATSRRTLGIPGEHVVRLAPLPVPSPTDPIDVARAFPIVQMLADRLRARAPDLEIDAATVRSLVRLAAVVDGLPLGVELLAGWADVMDPLQMLQRLQDPLAITAHGPGAAADRHYSLERVFAWSWASLDPALRSALVRLASFRGDWRLDAAEAVCGAQALEAVRELMDRSLVIHAPSLATDRYRVLSPVRAFVRRHAERGELAAADRRTASYYARLAVEVGDRLDGPDDETATADLGPELENIAQAIEVGFSDIADENLRRESVEAAAAVWPLWERLGRFVEGREVLQRAVAVSSGMPLRTHAGALLGLGMLEGLTGDYAASQADLLRCVEAMRLCGDREGEAAALVGLASRSWDLGDIRRAADLFQAAHHLGETVSRVWSALGLAKIAAHEDRFDDARALQQDALRRATTRGCRRRVADVLQEISVTEWFAGHPERSRAPALESLAIYRRLGDRYRQLRSLWCLGNVAWSTGRLETARAYYLDATDIAVWGGHPVRIAYCLEAFASVAAAEGMHSRAARLYGAAQRLRDEINYGLRLPAEVRLLDRLAQMLRATLGPEAYEEALSDGRALTRSEAVQYATEAPA